MNHQLQNILAHNTTPQRIISLVPSQTELLCDLGLEASIVGVTKFCVHPNFIRAKSSVIGGTKQIHIEKIRALKPDIILCNKEKNTKQIVEDCEAIAPVHISDIYNIEDSIILIKQYGIIFKKEHEALNIISDIEIELKEFENFVEKRVAYKTVYFIWKSPWMVVANNTFINSLMKLNKFDNYFKDKLRYPEIKLQKQEHVDLVLLSSEPYPFKKRHIVELKVFYPNAKIYLVDGEMFSWYGSRLAKAIKYFKSLHESL
ncbi:ABC transporter substrate-binding protein [Hyunsoonleella sp. 2307UL5-6]|uniref:ABC transporter substrate-binding protein n=1 Tax=Hyunsoonleella sp. 2307UL5-6 TaxID=3384768 RepID=UPI0039BD12B8